MGSLKELQEYVEKYGLEKLIDCIHFENLINEEVNEKQNRVKKVG